VLAELRSRGVDFEAWIAGSGTLADGVRDAIRAARLGQAVRMVGVLSPAELAEQLRQTSVFLMTSRWEGVPRGALEALACGSPVASTAVGEIPAIVTEGTSGTISAGTSVGELAAAVEQTLELEPGPGVAATVSHLEARRVVPELLDRIVADGG
jgi:glycosyltransferase involved in cell wall biosynthesis